MYRFTSEQRRARLALRHHLATPAESVEEVAASLVGMHSSDPTTVYLTARARVPDFRRDDLDNTLYTERTLLRHLGMRRTLFVVPRDLAAVMDAGCTRLLAAPQRRRLVAYLQKQGVAEDGDTWLADVEERALAALHRIGPATAMELRSEVPELTTKLTFGEGKTWGGEVGVSTRVLFLLATGGQIVRTRPRGTWLSSQYRWALMADWLSESLADMDTAPAQAELVRRWLFSYGPGSLVDIAWWTGWGKGVTSQALDACGAVGADIDGVPGFVLPDDLDPTPQPDPWVAFLPSLDSSIMGWKERTWYLGDHQPALYDRNGNAGPTIWADGRVVGGWTQSTEGRIRYRLLDDIGQDSGLLVEQEAARLEAWLSGSRLTPRFRTPLEKELAGK